MSGYQMTFERTEMKYLLDPVQYLQLKERLMGKMETDQYGNSTICNVYFDTPDARLIRKSLEKPVYKEKFRLRSYGLPGQTSSVFLELKKKYQGIVYKRRETLNLADAEAYLYRGIKPERQTQVLREIDWFLHYYEDMVPAMYISYERTALYGLEDENLRLTLDGNILWRTDCLRLENGPWGTPLLEDGWFLMEIKIPGSMPLWLGHILDELKIYPASFSKYGQAYEKQQIMRSEKKGGISCA